MSPTIFSPEQTQRIAEGLIPTSDMVRDHHRFAIVGDVNEDGTQLVARFTKHSDRGWELDGDAVWEHDWSGDNRIGGRVLFAY
jgi:hypothetical protein